MKNKYVKSMMGLMLSVSLIAGGTIGVYAEGTTETATESTTEAGTTEVATESTTEAGSEKNADAKEETAEEDAVYGEVKSVDEDTITFTVGTKNETPGMDKPDEKESDSEAADKPDEKEPGSESFLTLTSEEREVTVSADTEIVKGMMFDGEKPEGAKPEGEKPDGEKTDGEKSDDAKPEDEKPVEEDQKDAETLTIDDIKVGDIIKVTYDKDNNVTKIEVMSTSEEKPGEAVEKAAEQEEGTEEATTEETTTEETTTEEATES